MKCWAFLAALLVAGGVAAAPAPAVQPPGLTEADQLWAAGKLDQAQAAFEAAATAAPTSSVAQTRLGGFQLSRQQYSESIKSFQRAIGLDAKNSRAWMGLGLAYLHTDRKELAQASFEEALKADPAQKERIAPVLAELRKQ